MSTRPRIWLIAVGLSVIEAIGGYAADALAQEPIPVKREILALYDGAQEGDAGLTRIHRFAEMPLNHLGFILRFHDVRTKLPAPAEMERYRGVLTWFAGSVPNSIAYLAWASQISRMNVRYVILGDIGVATNSTNILAVNRWLELAGVHHTGDHIAPPLGTRVVQKDQKLVEFECRLGPVLSDYPVINASGSETQIGLTLETPVHDGKRKSVAVAIGKKGAYAGLNYEFCHQRPPLYQGRWLINPFAFFSAAFDFEDQPIPDTTTASGNRLYFSILESEGSTRSSKIEGFRDASVTAGEVVVRELIEPFRDLPATIELKDKEIVKFGRSGKQTQSILERLLAGPNVDQSRRPLRTTLSRFDSEYPSISNLSALIGAGTDRLVNAPMSDETAYGNAAPVGENGFAALKETIANTDSPRRLKPFNLNYHAYAGEYPALLRSVKDRLQVASQATLTPVSANRYTAIVDGFFSARIHHLGSNMWRISDRGALQTVRFDADESREVDIRSSTGVIGQRRDRSTLYVALDETIEPAVIVLGPPALSRAASLLGTASLLESRWLVRRITRGQCALGLEAQGYGDGSFTWSDVGSGRYIITVDRAGHEVWRQSAESDEAGMLKFLLPVSAIDPVAIRINCAGTASTAGE